MTDLAPAVIDERYELSVTEDPATYMEAMLGRAVLWLGEVEKIEDVINHKAATEAIKTFIREKELGHDAELAATEIVRRCERRIGQLVRQGQDKGEIGTRASAAAAREAKARGCITPSCVPNAREYFGDSNDQTHSCTMASATDDQFDDALAEAKAERNLSRANVVRKVKAKQQPVEPISEPAEETAAQTNGRSEWHRKTRRIDPNRVVREMAITLDGLASTIALVEAASVDTETVDQWADSMKQSLRAVTRFIKELTRE